MSGIGAGRVKENRSLSIYLLHFIVLLKKIYDWRKPKMIFLYLESQLVQTLLICTFPPIANVWNSVNVIKKNTRIISDVRLVSSLLILNKFYKSFFISGFKCFCYNPVHNISKNFDRWANFLFTTNEMKHDYY